MSDNYTDYIIRNNENIAAYERERFISEICRDTDITDFAEFERHIALTKGQRTQPGDRAIFDKVTAEREELKKHYNLFAAGFDSVPIPRK